MKNLRLIDNHCNLLCYSLYPIGNYSLRPERYEDNFFKSIEIMCYWLTDIKGEWVMCLNSEDY